MKRKGLFFTICAALVCVFLLAPVTTLACEGKECVGHNNATHVQDILDKVNNYGYSIEVAWLTDGSIKQVYIVTPDNELISVDDCDTVEALLAIVSRTGEQLTPLFVPFQHCCGVWRTRTETLSSGSGSHFVFGFVFACYYTWTERQTVGWFTCRPNSVTPVGPVVRTESHSSISCLRQ